MPARSAARTRARKPARTRTPVARKSFFNYTAALLWKDRLAHQLREAGVLAGSRGTLPWFVVAGSVRRKSPVVRDLDVLLVGRTDAQWAALRNVRSLMLTQFGPKKARGMFGRGAGAWSGIQVDLRRVEPRSLGAALEYFTGPRGHNLGMRMKAKRRGWLLNEYGLFDAKGHRIAGRTEQEIYDALRHPWKPPELRGR